MYIDIYIFIAVLTDGISIVGLPAAVMAHHFLFFTYEECKKGEKEGNVVG
jgi:hypothetical protein